MRRDELEHAIRAACFWSGQTEIVIFGSQAILGQYPDPPEALRQSMEVDVGIRDDPAATDLIDGAIGELSQFHETHGFYVHGVSLEAARLPAGWERRLVKVQNENTQHNIGWCIEAHDLAASKLVAFRDKDRAFVRVLLAESLVDAQELVRRIRTLDIPAADQDRLAVWVTRTNDEINSP